MSENPQVLESFELTPTYLDVRTTKSKVNIVVVTSDSLSSSHQTAPAPQCEVGDGTHLSIELSHPPTPPSLDLCANLADKVIGFHMDLFPQPPSPRSIDPQDCTMLCSVILDFTLIVHEDQVFDEVGVE